jgi:hypothetical protein
MQKKTMLTGATYMDGEVRTAYRQNTVRRDRKQLSECVHLTSLERTAGFGEKPYMGNVLSKPLKHSFQNFNEF